MISLIQLIKGGVYMDSEQLKDLKATINSILNNSDLTDGEKLGEIMEQFCGLDDLEKINSDIDVDGLGPKKGKK